MADESAVIVWDQAHGMQHFIRRAIFDTKARDIGFLVPTPDVPQLGEADNTVFDRLDDAIAPRVVVKHKYKFNFSPLLSFPEARENGAGTDAQDTNWGVEAGEAPVHIIASQRVAGYDAVVLAARDGNALNAWLKKHKYVSGPALARWLQRYIRDGWKITAFKIAHHIQSATGASQVVSAAVRMSFKTKYPIFPYREPAAPPKIKSHDGYTYTPSRLLRVYFFSTQRMEGTFGLSKNKWRSDVTWSNELPAGKVDGLVDKLNLSQNRMPAPLWLTAFEDYARVRQPLGDLLFRPAADQSPVVPDPVFRYNHHRIHLPADVVIVLLLVGGATTMKLRKRKSKK